MTTAVEYDKTGRMKYHPDYHPNQGKPYTLEDKAYVCKFYDQAKEDKDVKRLALEVGRTVASVYQNVRRWKRLGEFERFAEAYDKLEQKVGKSV